VLAGIVMLAIGAIGGSPTAIGVGVVLAALGGLEVSAREHFAGYRSHTTLLAGVVFVLVTGALFYLAGLVVLLVAGVVAWLLVDAAGGIHNFEDFMGELLSAKNYRIVGGQLLLDPAHVVDLVADRPMRRPEEVADLVEDGLRRSLEILEADDEQLRRIEVVVPALQVLQIQAPGHVSELVERVAEVRLVRELLLRFIGHPTCFELQCLLEVLFALVAEAPL